MKRFILGISIGLGVSILTVVSAATIGRFRDVPSGQYYSEAVTRLLSMNVISDNKEHLFNPGSPLTRAAGAVMIDKAIKIGQEGVVAQWRSQVRLGGLLINSHLIAYINLFRTVPISAVDFSDLYKKEIDKLEKVFTANGALSAGPVGFYAEKGWQNKKLNWFVIHQEDYGNNDGWYGPFFDDIKRLSGEVEELSLYH